MVDTGVEIIRLFGSHRAIGILIRRVGRAVKLGDAVIRCIQQLRLIEIPGVTGMEGGVFVDLIDSVDAGT